MDALGALIILLLVLVPIFVCMIVAAALHSWFAFAGWLVALLLLAIGTLIATANR